MRISTFFIICIISINSYSTNSVAYPDRFKIEYYNHWYPFGKEGKFYTKEEFNYSVKNEKLTLENYKCTTKELKGDSVLTNIQEKVYNKEFPNNQLNKILTQLSTNSIPLEIDSIDKYNFVRKITLGNLKRTAKKTERSYFFEDNSKEENDNIIKSIKSFAVIDSFIFKKTDYQYQEIIMVDYCNHAEFKFYYNNDSICYESAINNFIAQPYITGKSERKFIYNYEINKALIDLLPKKSLLRENLELNSQLDEYIDWFLDWY